jgi:tetratricopeptide (TPR) repeat protein
MGLAGLLEYLWLHVALLRAAVDALRAHTPGAAAAAAALSALWVVAKLNGVSYSAVWPACWLAGPLASAVEAKEAPLRAGLRMTLLCLCIAGASIPALRAAAADHACRQGILSRRAGAMQDGAKHLEKALSLRPGVLEYRFDLDLLLWDVAGAAAPPERALLYARAVEVALGAVRAHPLHPEAYWLLGLAEERFVREGRKDRAPAARAAWEAALALDPGYTRVAEALGELSRVRK